MDEVEIRRMLRIRGSTYDPWDLEYESPYILQDRRVLEPEYSDVLWLGAEFEGESTRWNIIHGVEWEFLEFANGDSSRWPHPSIFLGGQWFRTDRPIYRIVTTWFYGGDRTGQITMAPHELPALQHAIRARLTCEEVSEWMSDFYSEPWVVSGAVGPRWKDWVFSARRELLCNVALIPMTDDWLADEVPDSFPVGRTGNELEDVVAQRMIISIGEPTGGTKSEPFAFLGNTYGARTLGWF